MNVDVLEIRRQTFRSKVLLLLCGQALGQLLPMSVEVCQWRWR